MAVSVTFGGAAATGVTVVSDTQITATTPAGTGVVDVAVTTSGGSDTLEDAFTYQAAAPVPTITTIDPQLGPEAGGTTVTVNGTGFSEGA